MSDVLNNFLKYISYDTQSCDGVTEIPSTEKQKKLGMELVQELKNMGAAHVKMDEHGYVYAEIPATISKKVPVLGFISHMDTAPAFSGNGVSPQIIKNYNGQDIVLDSESGIIMKTDEFPDLLHYIGDDLITTNGKTLLGADDKAGIAEIMAMARCLLSDSSIPHGTIKIGFTPDEEVGRGADLFDVEGFGADVAYTVDGGEIGELEYENFNAASARIIIHGSSIHPGSSKGKMKNAILLGMELHSMLPVFENPMYTEGYEGFFHLDQIDGTVELLNMDYIIRDHDSKKFQQKKELMSNVAGFLNQKYGDGTIELVMKDSYYNMKSKILPHMYLIDIATDAMKELGIDPIITPIRGGTDGARLSFMGLPCPNICTGGHNFHGKYEFISIQSMEKITELLITIVKRFPHSF